LFGAARAVSIPYDASFSRGAAHYSLLYFGASLAALEQLARAREYVFVGCSSAGNNAFFVRDDIAGDLPVPTAADAWTPAGFREGRRLDGGYAFASRSEMLATIGHLPLVDVGTGERLTVSDLPPER
ncbi:MAG: hypothetical protein H0W68_06370, partial [Gemmatimonadaceae bacterium]|nr:hypothetical protein [Gemmatimonadaceae bacterium]